MFAITKRINEIDSLLVSGNCIGLYCVLHCGPFSTMGGPFIPTYCTEWTTQTSWTWCQFFVCRFFSNRVQCTAPSDSPSQMIFKTYEMLTLGIYMIISEKLIFSSHFEKSGPFSTTLPKASDICVLYTSFTIILCSTYQHIYK